MTRAAVTGVVVLAILGTWGVGAEEPAAAGAEATSLMPAAGAEATGAAVVLDAAAVMPRTSGKLFPRTERKLELAFQVARARVQEKPACRELFAELDADALDKLSTTLYYSSTAEMESRVCRRGVAAFTYLDSPQTRLCRNFGRLQTERAAMTLIHEALHWAGLSEQPLDPDGLRAREIDLMVERACGS